MIIAVILIIMIIKIIIVIEDTDKKLDHNMPDMTMIDKKTKVCWIMDVAYPFDRRIDKKEQEKIEAYTELKYEILKIWNTEVQKVVIVPIVIGAIGSVYRTLLEGNIDGTRGRGRPRTSWYDNIKEWTGMRYEQATRIAMDREKWRAAASSNVER